MITLLPKMLESQKTDALHTQSEIRHTAETHMAELEERLDNLEQSLSQERAATSLVKEEHRKVIEGLEMDIAQLQEKLVKVIHTHTHTHTQPYPFPCLRLMHKSTIQVVFVSLKRVYLKFSRFQQGRPTG